MTWIDAGIILRLLSYDQKQTHILYGRSCKIKPRKASIFLFQARSGSENEMHAKGGIFEDTAKIPAEMQEMLDSIRKRELQRCFQNWENR
jgi:hypothetical protein